MNKWRVGNISLAVMLILLGILLLFSQLYNTSILGLIATWWPVIIILLGIEVLIYIPLSRRENTHIQFDIISIIVIMLTLLSSVVIYSVNNFAAGKINLQSFGINFNKFETRVQKNFVVAASGKEKFELNNLSGNISFEKAISDKVEIDAEIIIRNNDEESAKKAAESLIKIEEGKSIRVTSLKNSTMNTSINYQIRIPANLPIDLNNKFGNVEFSGISNKVDADNTNGNIDVNEVVGDVAIHNSFGNIHLEKITGNANVNNKNGQLEISNVSGGIEIENSFGNIEVENVPKGGNIVNKNGNITVSNKDKFIKDMSITNSFGNIDFSIPENQNGYFKASLQHGNIGSNLGLPLSKDVQRQTMEGQIVDSNVKFIIKNNSGNITVDKV